MAKQTLVIGLGQFGLALAEALAEQGAEVIAVDIKPALSQAASAFVAQAVTLDATDEVALSSVAPERRDVCVVAIGDESREASILVTAMLKQMGARRIVARATDMLMERILRLVGANEVVNPERAYGQRLATRLVHTGIIDEMPLGEDLVITEVVVAPALVGRSLAALELPRRFKVVVVAIRRMVEGRSRVVMPDPRAPLQPDDILVIVAEQNATRTFTERIS